MRFCWLAGFFFFFGLVGFSVCVFYLFFFSSCGSFLYTPFILLGALLSFAQYIAFIDKNIYIYIYLFWKSKKQDVVARFNVEAEYRAMTLAICEFIWLKHLLQELRFGKEEQMKLICDNQAA